MIKEIGKLYTTTNYHIFKYYDHNRVIDQKNVERLKKSILENKGLLQPVLVDKDFYVVDGQHRVTACKEVGMPVIFNQLDRAYTIEEVQEIQRIRQAWKIEDYVESEVKRGENDCYEVLLEYSKKYSLPLNLTAAIFLGTTKNVKTQLITGNFHFTPKQKQEAFIVFKKLNDIREAIGIMNEKLYRGLILFFKSPEYDHERMVKQMEKHFHRIFQKSGRNWHMSKKDLVFNVLTEVYNFGYGVKTYPVKYEDVV